MTTIPSPTMLPEIFPAALLGGAIETGLVTIGLIVLTVLVGLCVQLMRQRPAEGAEPRRASLHPMGGRQAEPREPARAA